MENLLCLGIPLSPASRENIQILKSEAVNMCELQNPLVLWWIESLEVFRFHCQD